ncbi:hypothetical protein DT075_03980 [Bacillus licheniformis]|nr:hypothetical protein DT075_03980 [Bacillus licheniformis]
MKYLIGLIGLFVVLGLAWLVSSGKKRVKYRPVIVMIVLQFALGYILLIALMRKTVGPDIGVKASGGIRTKEDVETMISAGATRIGASAGVSIVSGAEGKNEDNY